MLFLNANIYHPRQQSLDRDSRLQPREQRPKAGMRSSAERHVISHIGPIDIKFLWLLKMPRIVARCRQADGDDRACRYVYPADGRAFARQSTARRPDSE
jgi:hypothetical protein